MGNKKQHVTVQRLVKFHAQFREQIYIQEDARERYSTISTFFFYSFRKPDERKFKGDQD